MADGELDCRAELDCAELDCCAGAETVPPAAVLFPEGIWATPTTMAIRTRVATPTPTGTSRFDDGFFTAPPIGLEQADPLPNALRDERAARGSWRFRDLSERA
jgi:hypothetical protein